MSYNIDCCPLARLDNCLPVTGGAAFANVHLAYNQERRQHLTQVFQHLQILHVAVECLAVAEKISSSTAAQDMNKSDHDAVLNMHINASIQLGSMLIPQVGRLITKVLAM